MDLSNFEEMDPDLLLGVLNTELRNHCDDLDDLCHIHAIQRVELEAYLSKADYHYLPQLNQFR